MATERRSKQLRADEGHQVLREPTADLPLKGRDRVQRFLETIRLLAAGREFAAKEFSEEFNVTERTVLRDMKVLEAAGLVVRPGPRHRGYRLARQAAWERPQLSLAEVLALVILAGSAADFHSGEAVLARSTIAKLIDFQPDDARKHLERLLTHLEAQDAQARHWLCGQCWLPLLVHRLAQHAPLRVWLLDASGSASEPLVLVPNSIEVREGAWLLDAFQVGASVLLLELASVAAMEPEMASV